MSDPILSADAGSPGPGWRKGLVVAVLLLVVAAVGVRWATYTPPSTQPIASTVQNTGTTLGQLKSRSNTGLQAPKPAQTVAPEGLQKYLPFVSEGGLALLLGLGMGLASRAFAKLLAVGVLLFFVALQYFSYQGVVAVDYAALLEWLKQFVFNISGGEDLMATLTAKLPSMGSLGVGYLIGLKK